MYLAEDRVSINHLSLREQFSQRPFLDLVLGTGIEARRVVGPSLRQVGLRRHGYSGSGAWRIIMCF